MEDKLKLWLHSLYLFYPNYTTARTIEPKHLQLTDHISLLPVTWTLVNRKVGLSWALLFQKVCTFFSIDSLEWLLHTVCQIDQTLTRNQIKTMASKSFSGFDILYSLHEVECVEDKLHLLMTYASKIDGHRRTDCCSSDRHTVPPAIAFNLLSPAQPNSHASFAYFFDKLRTWTTKQHIVILSRC